MSSIKPITLWGHPAGPNPCKVLMVIKELNLPYHLEPLGLAEVKQEPFLSLNPNGRAPAIEDPNTGVTLWESGAIIEYLVETYDKEETISYTTSPERFLLKQWLHFQMSGQGPYFGQLAWFKHFHNEDIPSAKERYTEQTVRVFGVIDRALEGKQWLVGDKCTFADIAFVPWSNAEGWLLGDDYLEKYEVATKYPNYLAWRQRLLSRPIIKEVLQIQAEAKAKAQRN